MRQFLMVAVLGATLALSAGAAFASDKVDHSPAVQPMQNEAIVSQTDSVGSAVAGDSAPVSVWSESRYDNFGQ